MDCEKVVKMQLIEAQQVVIQHGYALNDERQSPEYNEFVYLNGKSLVVLEEALRFNLSGKCNLIRVSANLTGFWESFKRFWQSNELSGIFPPQDKRQSLGVLTDWDLRASLLPMNGLAALEKVLSDLQAFEVRSGAVEVWSGIKEDFVKYDISATGTAERGHRA